MSLGSMPVIASVNFVPVAAANQPVAATSYMRNATGTGANTAAPERVGGGEGHYRFSVPDDIDPLHTSVVASHQSAAGLGRNVSVVLTPWVAGVGPSVVDVFLRSSIGSANGALVADATGRVEVSLQRVPDSRGNTIASMVFTPVGAGNPTVFAAHNCTGLVGAATDAPIRDGVGRYHFFVAEALLPRQVSITTHATNATGDNRFVKAVLGAPVGTLTRVDVLIDNGTPAASDDALFVEVTIRRLPL